MNYKPIARPHGDEYARLLEAVADLSAFFGVVVRSEQVRLSEEAKGLLRQLEPQRVSVEWTARWPGTEMIGGRLSERSVFNVCEETVQLLKDAADGLFQWVNPRLPEDLHFLRFDGSTVMGSIAQHDDVWLELDAIDLKRWGREAPRLERE